LQQAAIAANPSYSFAPCEGTQPWLISADHFVVRLIKDIDPKQKNRNLLFIQC